MHTERVDYFDGSAALEGFAAYPVKEKRPVVILCHAWRGRDDYICKEAERIANWGYTAFALDIYGKGVLGNSKEENAALKRPFLEDRGLLQRRLMRAWETVQSLPYADPKKIAVVGFGFGGLCALDFARSGADLKGAVSVYGHFDPLPLPKKKIHAKVLILHGYDDPVVKPEELRGFAKEMAEAKADWLAHLYSNTVHAFMNPAVNDPAAGLMYNSIAAERAWEQIRSFLKEVF